MGLLHAVTVSSLLGDLGPIAGLAAALASALLAGIVLAQGREMKRLRDALREESERALAVEGSLTASLAAAQRQEVQPAPQAAPAARAVTDDVPVVAASGSVVASSGRPALGSATPSPAVASVALAPVLEPPATPDLDRPTVTNGSGPPIGASESVVIPAPPVPPAVAAARSDQASIPLGEPSTVAAGGISRSPRPPAAEPPRKRRAIVPFLLGGLVIVGIVVFAVSSIGGGDGNGSASGVGTETTPATNPAAGSIVAVLNGTPVSGLAGQVSRELVREGFKAGRVATARDQQQVKTVVAYLPGHLTDAEGVVQALGIKAAPVPADDAVQAIACPDPATCNVEVIVTVGSDRARAGPA